MGWQVHEHTGETPKPAASRLRKHADYQRAYAAAGRKLHSREMSFFFARRDRMPAHGLHPAERATTQTDGPRIGLTVPKVLGKAHDRNRIKRRLRAALALHAGELANLPVDVILHPRRSVLLLGWEPLQSELKSVLRTVRKGYDAPARPEGQGAPRAQGGKPRRGSKGAAPVSPR